LSRARQINRYQVRNRSVSAVGVGDGTKPNRKRWSLRKKVSLEPKAKIVLKKSLRVRPKLLTAHARLSLLKLFARGEGPNDLALRERTEKFPVYDMFDVHRGSVIKAGYYTSTTIPDLNDDERRHFEETMEFSKKFGTMTKSHISRSIVGGKLLISDEISKKLLIE
jgi:hypothetical protein